MPSTMQNLRDAVTKRFNTSVIDFGLDWHEPREALTVKNGWPSDVVPDMIVRDHVSSFLGVFRHYRVTRPRDLEVLARDLYSLSLIASDAGEVARRAGYAAWSVHLFAVVDVTKSAPKDWDKEFSALTMRLLADTNVLSTVGLTRLAGSAEEIQQDLIHYANGDWVHSVCNFLAPLLLEVRAGRSQKVDDSIPDAAQHLAAGMKGLWPTPPASHAGGVQQRKQLQMTEIADVWFQPLTEPAPVATQPIAILKRLNLRNLRRFKLESIEFSPITVMYGGNGSGKTTVFDALEVALTGSLSRLETAQEPGSNKFYQATLSYGGEPVENWGELEFPGGKIQPLKYGVPSMVTPTDYRSFALTQEDMRRFVQCTPLEREAEVLEIWGFKGSVHDLRGNLKRGLAEAPNWQFFRLDDSVTIGEDPDSGYVSAYVEYVEQLLTVDPWLIQARVLAGRVRRCMSTVQLSAGASMLWHKWLMSWDALVDSSELLLQSLHSGDALPSYPLERACNDLAVASGELSRLYAQRPLKDRLRDLALRGTRDARPVSLKDLFVDLVASTDFIDIQDAHEQFDGTTALQDPESSAWMELQELGEALVGFLASPSMPDAIYGLPRELGWYYEQTYPYLLERNWLAKASKRVEDFVTECLEKLTDKPAGNVFKELIAALSTFNWTHLELEQKGAHLTARLPGSGNTSGAVAAMLNQAEQQIIGLAWFLTTYLIKGHKRSSTLLLDDPFQGLDDTNLHNLLRLFNDILRLLGAKQPQVILCLHQGAVVDVLKNEHGFQDLRDTKKAATWPSINFYNVLRCDSTTSRLESTRMYQRKPGMPWKDIFAH